MTVSGEPGSPPVTDGDAAADDPVDPADGIPAEEHRRRSRRAFLTWGLAGLAGVVGFRRLQSGPESDNLPTLIRRGLEVNDDVWSTLERDGATGRTFDLDDREDLRVNGLIGLDDPVDDDEQLTILGPDGEVIETLDVATVRALPVHDLVWEHKCIEGWASVVHWTGARFADLAARYHGTAVPADHRYVGLRTPDEQYYVGLDRDTALHPQTLLAWNLNGEPLTEDHGAPLRLAMPTTYGIKQLKRIGTIQFTNDRPPDYWAERGYDWHATF